MGLRDIRRLLGFPIVFCGLLLGIAHPTRAGDRFRDQVAPLLQRRCLGCHSNDQYKGDFSLQTAEAALAEGYIEAGDADGSRLVEVITPTDGKAAEMPKDADPLSTEEITIIRRWIDDGASWPKGFVVEEPRVSDFDWWSYQTVKRPAVPDVQSEWVRTPIDAFILDKLRENELTHSQAADRRTLIRRLTYDLLGLPPTPEETEAFLDDPDPKAYEKLVDRLLSSDHYGERWARHWLDVVKYADTCGYDKDKLRPNAWPYRDYVIRSFNEDKPYAKFVQEQIAGDVLFPGEPDGILGLGFIAAGPWDFIGHVEVPESKIDGKVARNLDRDDMVANTLNTFCSVTVQCARCHNHKFDPITQENYYGLQSIFAAVDRANRPYDLDPDIEQRRRELESEVKASKSQLDAIKQAIADKGGPRLEELNKQIREHRKTLAVRKGPEFGYHSAIVSSPGTEKWVVVDLGNVVDVSSVVLRPSHDEFGGIGAGFGFPVRFRIEIATDEDGWVVIRDETKQDFPNPGLGPVKVEVSTAKARRIRVTATKLFERQHDYILALAELQVFGLDEKNVALGAEVTSLDSVEAPDRWGRKNLTDGKWPRFDQPELADTLASAEQERIEILATIETPELVKRRQSMQAAMKKAQDELASLPQGKMVYAAATHFKPQGGFKPTEGKLRPIHVLHRGNIQQPRNPAAPCLLPLDGNSEAHIDAEFTESERRVVLARWLTNQDHPLVWRSIVNRIWQYHFGQGLVATPNDFGRMGAKPSHPELLDWLAIEFRDGGQSFKQLHRLIVTSSAYRQSSRFDEANAAIDGSNRYLWRMNRRRLTAEEIRDSILAVSGEMNSEMGGAGFYLFVLEKTDHSPHYEYHKFDPTDTATHRRSIYRFIVRSQPDPWMTTLDCADSSQSTPKRNETLTSLQALSLLNNKFNLAMAERFAERLKVESDNLAEQVNRAVLLVTQRQVTAQERDELQAYAEEHGLANMCRLLLNLSEFVYLD